MTELGVYKAITAVALELSKTGIGKNNRNQQQGYQFRGIDDVYNELAPLISKNALVILPRCIARECVERVNKNGTALFYVTVEAEFDFVSADDGSRHTVRTFGEAMDSGDKATNKAMSAAYKYAAFQTFCIPTEGDNDADATTHEVKPGSKPVKPAAPTATEQPKAEVSEAQTKLGIELSDYCGYDKEKMEELLHELSHYEKDGKSGALKLADLTKKSDSERFQRWVGATLQKLRKKVAETEPF